MLLMQARQRVVLTSRAALPADLDDILRIERAAWPAGRSMRSGGERFASRIDRGLVLVTLDAANERVVGFVTRFRPRWASAATLDALGVLPERYVRLPPAQRWRSLSRRYGLPIDWHAATNDGDITAAGLHDPHGEVCFGVGISTDPNMAGAGVAQTTLRAALADASAAGCRYFMGYGRLPGFAASGSDDVERYMAKTRSDGGPADLGLRNHWKAGARPARSRGGPQLYVPIPNAMTEDAQSRGWGFLVTIPVAS